MIPDHEGMRDPAGPIQVADHSGAVIVDVGADLETDMVQELRSWLSVTFRQAAERGTPVVVDLSKVDFVSSTGLSLLVEYHLRGDDQGTPLRVVAPARSALRALRATRLDELLELYTSLSDALAVNSE